MQTETQENCTDSAQVRVDCVLGSDIAGRPDMTTVKIAKLKMLAEAVLKAHKGQGYCKDCLHVEYGDDYQRCHGGEYDCCKCAACNEARLILGA